MSKAQVTEGPWVYHAKTASIQPYPGRGTICTLSHSDELEANARLIAAAPNLLAVLEASPQLVCHHDYHNSACWPCAARAVIAKAKGEQS